MSNSHKIYSKGLLSISDTNIKPHIKYNREQLLSAETASELNTYLNFGVFPTFADTYIPKYNSEDNSIEKDDVGTPGVRSIFNRAGAIIVGSTKGEYNMDVSKGDVNNTHAWRIANNVPLMDSPEARKRIKKTSGCSIKELVEASSKGLMGQETYAYSDFMYCKHLGKVSNNYLVTLRRFPLPVDDYIGSRGEDDETLLKSASKQSACIGCMVTWMGVSGNELSNILKYSYNMPFKFETAEFQDAQAGADENTTKLSGMFAMFDSKYRAQYQAGYAGEAGNIMLNPIMQSFGVKGFEAGNAPYKGLAGFRDTKSKVYGPIDSVRSTYVRADQGLTFEQRISLTFEYELRSYNGINGKQAMLDLISNILNVTYTTGSFWGGGYKGFAAHQSNIFANLEIFKARGGFTNFVDAFSNDLSNIGGKVKENVAANGGVWETIKKLANNLGGMMMSGLLNKLGRPQKAMYNALLSPAPIGFWHVTIGNPKKPIMSIGNMVITNVSIEHNGPLGIDDFPTGLKVIVELDRGKPRDLRDIEKLYMHGTDRIYSSMSDKVFDMYKNSEIYKQNKGDLSNYNPVSNIATINIPADSKSKPTIKIDNYDKLSGSLLKYFGTTDAYAIYVPAAEQEYGSGKKKPSTNDNKNLKGGN